MSSSLDTFRILTSIGSIFPVEDGKIKGHWKYT